MDHYYADGSVVRLGLSGYLEDSVVARCNSNLVAQHITNLLNAKPYPGATHPAPANGDAAALRAALEEIKDTQGKVCDEFELCKHRACTSSYSSWAIAAAALSAPAPSPAQAAGAERALNDAVENVLLAAPPALFTDDWKDVCNMNLLLMTALRRLNTVARARATDGGAG